MTCLGVVTTRFGDVALTGADVFARADGHEGRHLLREYAFGLNIDTVIASSTQYAFEFDDVSYTDPIPDPFTRSVL